MQTILITGCSSGIGLETARLFAANGWLVFPTARHQRDVDMLRQEGFSYALSLDLADSVSVELGFREVLALSGGRLDAVFHNGGYGQAGALEDLPRNAVAAQFETNVFGPHQLTTLAIPVMRQQGHGVIVFNSSVLGYVPFVFRGAYAASKYALEALVDTLRIELKGSGVHAVLVEPGPIETRFRKNSLDAFFRYVKAGDSVHRIRYQKLVERLGAKASSNPFTRPASDVADAVWSACNAKSPKVRYRITTPSSVFWFAKRLLPSRYLLWLCGRVD